MWRFWEKDKPWDDGPPPYPGFQAYPKVLYHPKLAPQGKTFNTPEETVGLAKRGWCDSPAKFPQPPWLVAFLKNSVKPWWEEWKWMIAALTALGPFSYRCREGNFGAEAYFLENHYRKAPYPALQQ